MSKQRLISDLQKRLLSGLFFAVSMAGTTLAQPVLEPVPFDVKYADQAGNPVRVSLDGIRCYGETCRILLYSVQNVGDEPVWGIATKGMPGTANVKTFFANSLDPGKKTIVTTHLDRELPSEGIIATDAVIFLDGTVWGPNILGEADFLKGMHAGRLRLISDISEQLQNGDEKAVRRFINRQPYLPEVTSIEKKSKYEEGIVRAYGGEIMNFRHDLQGRRDIGTVSAWLAVLKSQMGVAGVAKNGKWIAKAFGIREPVAIEKIEVDGRVVPLNVEFTAGDDWMRGVVITLKNTSSKTIVSLSVGIDFPHATSHGSTMSYTVSLGRQPGLRPEVKIPERPPIKSGESFQIGFSEQEFANLSRFLNEQTPLSQLSRAEISIGMVYFDDGTAWSTGAMMRPDPNDATRWFPIKADN